LEYAKNHPVDFDLGKYVSKAKYVRLETKRKCLIGAVNRLMLINNDIYLSAYRCIYKFSSSGRFVRQIGWRGRGPAELKEVSEMSFNKTNNELCVSEYDAIVKYDTSGSYIGREKLKGMDIASSYKVDSKGRYFYKKPHAPKENIAAEVYDKDLKLIKRYNNSIIRDKGSSFQPRITSYDGRFYYNSLVNDTIFSIDEELNKSPDMILDFGKMKLPMNKYSYSENYFEKGLFTTGILVGENVRLIIVDCIKEYEGYFLYFNEQQKLIYPNHINKEEFLGIKMNGLNWKILDFSNGNIVMSIEPLELLENRDKIKDANLRELCNNLKEEDNPILAIVRIKGK